ncbi:hypothetical protein CQW49_15515 [Methylosinus trichosporium OB3b]|uniref:Uncharacterized protein n=1 Tax=Methylosinus trichosporium (strain ATCC 35070 / NCIMB 11131 / UNIQEM 75 / OB3b) TaxID=595536 RepID=A0A2D2D298_METT3|nr:hypothetical protein CQW49_15515 [Methylosinus trichosporium OB3b]OBS53551.1 hypothetical protein A8B73_04965 [Methylosinus sp. 3S-1]
MTRDGARALIACRLMFHPPCRFRQALVDFAGSLPIGGRRRQGPRPPARWANFPMAPAASRIALAEMGIAITLPT